MKKKWIYLIVFLFFLAFAFFIPITNSEIINSFNDSTTSKNFTGENYWEYIVYPSMPKYSIVSSGILNLIGHLASGCFMESLTNSTDDTEDASDLSSITDGANLIDENWDTWGYNSGGALVTGYINYTIPENVSTATWEVSLGSTSGLGYHWGYCRLANSSWKQIYSRTLSGPSYCGLYSTRNITNYTIPGDCLTGSVLEFRIDLDSAVSDFADFCEEQVIWSIGSASYPFNITLDISNDGDFEFNQTGILSTTNQTSNFASEINSYLSTCTANSSGFCAIPINTTGFCGKLELTNLNITYIESPRLSILSPSNYTNQTRLEINISIADTNLDNCKYTINKGVINTSFTCGSNITSGISDGKFINFTAYVNDTSGNTNKSNLVFSLDTTAPIVNIVYPTDYQSLNINENINVNFTRSDATFGINSCWWSNDSGVNNNTLATPTSSNISVTEAGDGNYIVYVWCNDTLNNVGTDLVHYTVSLSAPAITINAPLDNTWFQSGTNINFNVTATDDNGIRNCSLWGNWTGTWHLNQTNTTAITSGVLYPFTQTIPDSNGLKYKFGFECFDKTDTGAFSANFTFGVDEINPLINLTYPLNTSYNSIQTLLNYTTTETNPNTCWYSLNNGATNTTVTCGNNLTGLTSSQGSNTWKVWINDSANRINSSSKTFFIDSINPLVSLSTSFSDGDYLNYNTSIEINVTASDTNLNTCFYNIDLGTNNTFTCGTNLSLNVSNGVHTVYIYANDTLNNLNNTESISFIADTIYPVFNSLSISPSTSSTAFTISYNISDVNLTNCFYSVFNSSNDIDPGTIENTTLPCTSNNLSTKNDATYTYGTFNLFVYANDSAGNLNYTNKSFTTTQSTTSGGGGGGTEPSKSEVISLIQPLVNLTEQNNLSRAIIYAEIRRSCLDKTPCILNNEQKNELLVLLDSLDVILDIEQLDYWLDSYNKNYLEVVKLLDSQINEYNLFTGILQINQGNLIANPSRLDPFPPYFILSSSNPVFRTKIKFNKVINDSSLLEGSDSSLSINFTSTEATIILNITDSRWASKVYTGTASFTSQEGDVTFVPINLRVINVRNGFTIITGVIFIGVIVLITVFGKQITKTLKLKKITKEIDKKLKIP